MAKRELRLECDYRYELQSQQRFKALVAGDAYTARVRWGAGGGGSWWTGAGRGAGRAAKGQIAVRLAAVGGSRGAHHTRLPTP